ncbi:hypothetical protein Micbo1qcDRAFT_112123, partial [Microdochium bolleyi]
PFLPLRVDDRRALLATATLVASLSTATVILGKALSHRYRQSSLRPYDWALFLAVLFLLFQSILSVLAASWGVGKHAQSLDGSVLDSIAKIQYAVNALGIMVAFCTKLCLCLIIRAIDKYTCVRWATLALISVTIGFFLSTLLAGLFQCSLPTLWLAPSAGTCPAAVHVYRFSIVSNMVTDTLICVLAIMMMAPTQAATGNKVLVISLFSSRLLCLFTITPALLNADHIYNGTNTDFTWTSLNPSIWLIVSSHLSVITACIPSLKGVFDSWLGNTCGFGNGSPYRLERQGDQPGFAVVQRTSVSSKPNRSARGVSAISNGPTREDGRNPFSRSGEYGQSESVRGLTGANTVSSHVEISVED